MLLTIFLFFLGFYILVKGASFLVDGSVSIAKKFNIPNIVIGLVIVGIGTSLPELAVAFIGNLVGESDIGLGTIIGSNTFNMLFILGFLAIFFPFTMKPEWVSRDMLWNIAAIFVALVFALTSMNGEGWGFSRIEGAVMILFFIFWIYKVMKNHDSDDTENHESRILALPFALLFIIGGIVGVFLGGKWVVDGAVAIAKDFGVSEALIGLLIVGPGTSLPELAASFVAAYKRQPGIAVGNVIGSNIFDFLMILGVSAMAKPIVFPGAMFTDLIVTLFAALALFASMFIGSRYVLNRSQGFFMVLAFCAYMVFLFLRG